MKRFLWKTIFCLTPVLVSLAVILMAYYNYRNGTGGFKLGVDLAGGTDLIYEVDTDKSPEDRDMPEVAATLKRRIDPSDLFNVTIRPIGKDRVEIILPTGGSHQADAEDLAWNNLLREVADKWKPKGYKVELGHTTELLARINAQDPSIPLDDIREFLKANYTEPKKGETPDKAKWDALLAAAEAKWPARRYDVSRGDVAALVLKVREQYPDVSARDATGFINEHYKVSKDKRLLTTEEVQHIKELVAQVGKLEFRILANRTDDQEAIEAATKYFADAKSNEERKSSLANLIVAGKPPPPPVGPNGDHTFLAANDGQRHTYSWVELGKAERHYYGLNNKAEDGPRWRAAAAAREKGETYLMDDNLLLYSRDTNSSLNPRLSADEADKKVEYFFLTRDPLPGHEVTGDYVDRSFPDSNKNGTGLVVGFQFKPAGARLFEELTRENAPERGESGFHRNLAVVLDEKIESAPRINAIISDRGVIEGDFKKEDVDRLVKVFNAGRLKASLKQQPVSESTIGSTLGGDTVEKGAWSVVFAFVAILVFMLVYYRFAGLVACIALLANLLLTVAFMVLVNATFTLPGLAGLVLTLGMAVDANVLIYERLREERDRGASLALAIRNGYDRAFPTIIDTHLSSIFTAIVLYAVGNDQLKGFGISLTVGLVISLFTSLYMTRLLFDVWQYKGWLHKLSMARLFSRPNIDFMGIRYYWFTATILLTIFGATVFVIRGMNGLNIDFTGGTAYGGKLSKQADPEHGGMITAEQLRELFDFNRLPEAQRAEMVRRLPDLSIEQIFVNSPLFSEGGTRSKLFTVRTLNKDVNDVQAAISELLGNKLERTEMSYELGPNPKEASVILAFTDPLTKKPEPASRGQVGTLLAREFNQQGLKNEAQQFLLTGMGKEEDGRFQWMELKLLQPIDRAKLEAVVQGAKQEYARQPQPERLDNFDSALATDTQKRALYAILASWAAILLYLWFRFGNWTFGLAAVLCLIHDLFFTLGIIGFCHWLHSIPGIGQPVSVFGLFNFNLLVEDFKIDLPAVAALLTLVGYSVNDTIVVFDRIREVRGKNPLLTAQMINDSVNQTLSRTLLTSFATWLVVIVLYFFGGEGVHLFAFVMVVGVIVGTYSSIYIASPLLLIFGEGAKATARERQPAAQTEGALT
jgi:SecD/SecF fusion protein